VTPIERNAADITLVSVYIPTKNRLELLKRAIESVLDQTYPNVELIVVDDASTDGTREYLAKETESGRLRAIFNEESLGACAARNTAISHSRGEFVTGLDDDDYFSSQQRLELLMNMWKSVHSRCSGVYDSAKVLTEDGFLVWHLPDSVTYEQLRQWNNVGNQVFAPRKHYLEAGLFDLQMPAWQDWDLWIRMSRKFGPFVNVNRYTYTFDKSHDSHRITQGNERRLREAMYRLSHKMENISAFEKSCLVLALYVYPQVRPSLKDILVLLLAFRFRMAASILIRKLLLRGWIS
jgi:glycosyltransferase involved in cell wall biosynthesis